MSNVVYLKLFVDCLEKYQKLNDTEFGRLVRAALRYKATGAEPDELGREALLWDGMRLDIDRDNESYISKCSARAIAGKKGADARWQGHNKDSKNSKCHLPYGKNGQDKEKEKDKDKEEDKDNVCYANNARGAFDVFWDAYPKKVGKAQAKKSFAKVKVPLQTLLSAIEVQKQSTQWQKDGGQYIPNPATWLNQGRWEDELQCDTTSQKDPLLEMIERGDFRDNGGNSEDPFDFT